MPMSGVEESAFAGCPANPANPANTANTAALSDP
jgi:hypothetical protein